VAGKIAAPDRDLTVGACASGDETAQPVELQYCSFGLFRVVPNRLQTFNCSSLCQKSLRPDCTVLARTREVVIPDVQYAIGMNLYGNARLGWPFENLLRRYARTKRRQMLLTTTLTQHSTAPLRQDP
jgi:hypothetical protein